MNILPHTFLKFIHLQFLQREINRKFLSKDEKIPERKDIGNERKIHIFLMKRKEKSHNSSR